LESASCSCAYVAGSLCYFSGIYGGILYIVTGVIGIVASKKNSKCLLVSTLILSCVSLLVSLVGNITSFGYALYIYIEFYYGFDNLSYIDVSISLTSTLIGITATLVCLFIVQIVFASMMLCCSYSNSGESAYYGPQYPQQYPQGYVTVAPNQFVVNSAQYAPQPIYLTNQQYTGQFARQPEAAYQGGPIMVSNNYQPETGGRTPIYQGGTTNQAYVINDGGNNEIL